MTDIGYRPRPTVQYRPKDRPEKIWIDGLQEAYHGIRFTHVAWWLQLHHRSSLFADRLYHVNAALNSQVCNMAIIFITRFFRTRARAAREVNLRWTHFPMTIPRWCIDGRRYGHVQLEIEEMSYSSNTWQPHYQDHEIFTILLLSSLNLSSRKQISG